MFLMGELWLSGSPLFLLYTTKNLAHGTYIKNVPNDTAICGIFHWGWINFCIAKANPIIAKEANMILRSKSAEGEGIFIEKGIVWGDFYFR